MQVSWGPVQFVLTSVPDFTTTSVYSDDNVDFLYYHTECRATAWLNVEATRIQINSGGGAVATPTGGYQRAPASVIGPNGNILYNSQIQGTNDYITDSVNSNIATYKLILQLLAAPRQQLNVFQDQTPLDDGTLKTTYLLSQPYAGCNCDATGGPLFKASEISFDTGTNSALFDISFSTDWHPRDPNLVANLVSLNQSISKVVNVGSSPAGWYGLDDVNTQNQANIASQYNKLPPVMLSNRWTFSVSHNPQDFTAIHIIDGQAVFRIDVLLQRGMTVDEMRAFISHPVPFGFRRMPPQIDISGNGGTLSYRIEDVEQSMHYPIARYYGATKIEVVERREKLSKGSAI